MIEQKNCETFLNNKQIRVRCMTDRLTDKVNYLLIISKGFLQQKKTVVYLRYQPRKSHFPNKTMLVPE